MQLTDADPKGLIRESYAIDGITAAECGSIFIDWVLSVAADLDQRAAMQFLLDHYARGAINRMDHPMSVVLTTALQTTATPMRRGGRAAKLGY
jgi:hypothetical protein